MCHARPGVAAYGSVVTIVLCHASKTALPAEKAVAITANTESARRNVMNLVIPVSEIASGSASIISARSYAGSSAIVHDVTCPVQSYFPAGIPVLVSVGTYARRSVESVTKTR